MTTTDWCILAQTGILLFALLAAAWQVLLLRKQVSATIDELQEQHRWERQKATFDYLNMYITEFEEINRGLHDKIELLKGGGKQIPKDDIQAELKDGKIRAELFHLVSYFENLAIGISFNYFDDNIAYNLLFNVVVSTYEALKPYFAIRKSETGIDVAREYAKLAKRWQSRAD